MQINQRKCLMARRKCDLVQVMKIELHTDTTGCPTNLAGFLSTNSAWIAASTTQKSGAGRTRVVREHLLNHETLSKSITWQIIHQLYEATELADKGVAA